MKEVLEKIKQITDQENIYAVMDAVKQWYSINLPEWDIYYAAIPKDPKLRKEELVGLIDAVQKDLRWNAEQWELRKSAK